MGTVQRLNIEQMSQLTSYCSSISCLHSVLHSPPVPSGVMGGEGDCSGGEGDCSGGEGDCSGGEGDCLGGEGDCSGGEGDCSGGEGDCSGGEGGGCRFELEPL